MRSTHTYAILGISKAAYDEIYEKLDKAGYYHQFIEEDAGGKILIDMHGLALEVDHFAPNRLGPFCGAMKDDFTCNMPVDHEDDHRQLHKSGGAIGWKNDLESRVSKRK